MKILGEELISVNDLLPEHTVKAKALQIQDLWRVLAANGLFALLTNLFFLFDKIKPLKSAYSLWTPLLLGMGIYGVQAGLIWYLVQKYLSSSWLSQPFKAKNWYWGIGVGFVVWVIANGVLAYRLPEAYLRPNSTRSFSRFIFIFLFNSLPGAIIEEYLFRFLPVRFAESRKLSRGKTFALFLAVLLFFTATHIPAYLWQYHISLWSLWSPFAMGAAFFFVYYATRNLPFTALFHAFTNQSWVLYGPSNIKDYSLVIVVSILWYIFRVRRVAGPLS